MAESSPLAYFVVDAFAERAFEGNPAAVLVLPRALDERTMQLIAREMNLAETAFVVPRASGFDLRWFTPTVEVDLCGHATLASAHVLWQHSGSTLATLEFHTRSGVLKARRDGEWIVLDFPTTPAAATAAPSELLQALGAVPRWIGKSRFDFLCELDGEERVRALAPDLGVLAKLDARGVIVTARATGKFDFVSRFFAPGAGVPEDPVTGSAHCTLGPFWAERLGKNDLVAWQASARGGLVKVSVRGDRTLLAGHAITTVEGRLRASS